MVVIKTQGKKFSLEIDQPIEIEYKNKIYLLVTTKNGKLLLNVIKK